jgi:hypothetical protein
MNTHPLADAEAAALMRGRECLVWIDKKADACRRPAKGKTADGRPACGMHLKAR